MSSSVWHITITGVGFDIQQTKLFCGHDVSIASHQTPARNIADSAVTRLIQPRSNTRYDAVSCEIGFQPAENG